MNRTLLFVAALCVGCHQPHFDLQLSLACEAADSVSPLPTSCSDMHMTCANFIEARMYEWKNGELGDILLSNCLGVGEIGSPANVCALQTAPPSVALFPSLPRGKTVKFRLRALQVGNLAEGCNVDVYKSADTFVLFDGFSSPTTIDDSDHTITMSLSTCGTCGQPVTTGDTCVLDGGVPLLGGNECSNCAPKTDAGCLAAGDPCANGTVAQLVQSGCCAVCTSDTP